MISDQKSRQVHKTVPPDREEGDYFGLNPRGVRDICNHAILLLGNLLPGTVQFKSRNAVRCRRRWSESASRTGTEGVDHDCDSRRRSFIIPIMAASTPPLRSAIVAAKRVCDLRWAPSETHSTTRCANHFSQPWNANCWIAHASRLLLKPSDRYSSSSKDGTTRTVVTRP